MVETGGEDEEFEFYLKFAKPLVLNLPDTNDRIKAAAWIRYLKTDRSDLTLRGEYLKLLLFVLQRRKLYGPFSSIPNESEPLPKFPDDINIQDVAKNFIEIDKKILQATLEKGGYGEWPPFNVAFSSDYTEYATSQEIPGFGVHAYCAFSRDPLPSWNHVERAIFPIGETIDISKADCPLVDTGSPDISCFVSPDKPEPPPPPESPRRSPRIVPGGPEITPPSDVAPKAPQREQSPFKEDEYGMDDRVPPIWGSNLVEVKDLTLDSTPSPVKDLDIEVTDQDMLDFFNDDIDLFDADVDEAASYLQGDFFSPAGRGGPGAPGPPEGPSPAPCPSSQGPCPAADVAGAGSRALVPVQTPPHYSPQLPEGYVTSPHKMFDLLHDLASDKDMLDYYYPESPKLPEDDPAFYLQGFKLESPEMLSIEPGPSTSRPLTPREEVKRLERELYPDDESRRVEREATGVPLPPSPQRIRTPTAPCAPPIPPSPVRVPSPSPPCAAAEDEEALGGDSFIARDKRDYRWLADTSPGPGIPTDEQQDPALWESFGWWTEDPDEIFQYMSPSPRARGPAEEDPFAEERERWGEAVRTPPIFSRDPKIREGPAARRQYTIDEFGMYSFEEPVWTSAEQYLKYTKEFSPYRDPRDVDRRAYDPADYPNIEIPEMDRRLSDIQGAPEEIAFFEDELSPILMDVTIGDADLQPLTRVEAIMEALHHGPQFIGLPTPSPEKTPKEDSGEWKDMRFIEETPPLFMHEPPFLATPPEYEPNLQIEIDELDEDTVRRYNEEDLNLIRALIPATTPQRAPSPKRPPPMMAESPPFAPDIDVESEPYIPSPELVTPERHVVPPQRAIEWDTNIGSPIKLPETNAVVIVSEQDLLAQNKKRKQELAVIYERQFASPPRIPSPPPMPHLMDEPISSRLPPAMTPERLPPPGWSWQTPERFQPRPYVPQVTRTPTGISPPRPIPKELTMFYESPPEDLYAADFDMDFDLLSPPTPSPPRQPPAQVIPMSYWQKDIIERELQEPTAFDLEDVDLPDMPDFAMTPERATSTPIVQEFIKSDIRDLMPELFVASPQAAVKHEVVESPPKPPSKLAKGKFKAPPGRKLQPPSGRQLQAPSGSKLQAPSGRKLQAPSGRKLQAPSGSKLQAPSGSKLQAPSGSKLQAPSGSRVKPPSRSKLQAPCGSRLKTPSSSTSRIAKKAPTSKLKMPGARAPKSEPQIPKEEVDQLDQDIRDLEAELFPTVQRDVRPRRPPPTLPPPEFSPPTPEHQRRLWRQQLEMHDYKSYPKRSFVVHPTPGSSRRVAKYSHRPQLPGIPDSLESPPPSRPQPVVSPAAQMSPERAAWREQVRQHEATPFRRKIFHVRPKHGKAIALRGAKRPGLETVADTSPVDQADLDAAIRELEGEVFRPLSPAPPVPPPDMPLVPGVPAGVTVEQLNEEIARLEEELALLATPPRMASYPGDSPETPPEMREWWRGAIQQGEMEPYTKPRKHYKPPSLETILSPRHPDFASLQQERYVQDVRRQAARQVEYDKRLLTQEQERDLYQLPRQHRERAEYEMSDAERAYWRTRRIEIPVPSPPPRPVTPPSLLDEELPEGLPPCLMPPSGWDWRTPERYKQKPYVPQETRTPTGISPPRHIPPELTMFHESPPEDLYDLDLAMLSPPDFSPRTPSPPRAPPQPIPSTSSQLVPASYWQKDVIERELQWPGEIEALDAIQLPDIPDISPVRPPTPAAICPAAAASSTGAVCGSRGPRLTEAEAESQALRAEIARKRKDFRPKREFRVKRGSRMAPLERARPPPRYMPPIPGSPPGPATQREQLGREIRELYERSQLSTPLRRRGRPPPFDPDSPPTPDLYRRAFPHLTATHEMEPYRPRRQLYTPPTLPTVLSPGHPEFAETQRQEPVRALERHARRKVERDVREIREQQRKKLFQPRKRPKKPKCPCITVTGPTPSPEPVVTPEPPPHLLDEPVPEGQPQALLPPSGWIWKTPERYQPEPYVPKEKPVPTGISPPRQIPKELTMFHESPPEEFYSPEYDELDLALLTPPDLSPRTPSPCRTPQGQIVPMGYWQRDIIDRELQEPTDLDDVQMPAIADYEISPEEPRMITPERAAWRSSVEEHATIPLRKKIFHVRPTPGRSVALRGAKRPGLATVEDSSPPEPPMAVEGVPEGVTVDQLNREIEELERELEMLRTPPRPRTPPPGEESPPTPDIERRMWREMVRLHEPLPYTKTVTYSEPPQLETIYSQSHPSQAAMAQERYIADMRRQAARACAVDIDRILEEKHKDLYPLSERHKERAQYEMSDAEREYWRTRRYDFDVPSPPSPEPITVSPTPMHIFDEPVPEDLPTGLIRPSGWTYETPPKLKYRTPEERKIKTPTGIPSPRLPPLGTLFYESPPLISSPESDSPESFTPSPCAPSPGRPIAPCIPSPPTNLDEAMYEYDELDTELPPELYSSPEFAEPEYEAEIRDLEAEVFGPSPRGIRPRRPPRLPPPQEVSPPTPDFQRKVWRQELEMRDYVPYTKRSFMVKPKPGKSVRVAKYSHRPRLGAVVEPAHEPVPSTSRAPMARVEDPLEAEIRALEGEVFAPCAARRLPVRPCSPEVSPPTPQHERRLWRQRLEMHEPTPYTRKAFSVKPKPGKSVRVAKYSHRPKMEAVTEKYYEVSPVSPPLRPRALEEVSIPMPVVTTPPENWTWKTPSPLTQRGIYTESPPLMYSPPSPSDYMPQDSPTIRPTTPTPGSLFRRPAPPSPDYMFRIPAPPSPVSIFESPCMPSPLRSPSGLPVMQGFQDAFERAQAVAQDFDVIDLTSPDVIDLTSPDYVDLRSPSPPAPPPRPCTPQAFVPPPRRIPGRRPLDPNVLYADTPPSAQAPYEQLPETIRFEYDRLPALQPTTPEPRTGYYETPIPPATRPWRKQRKQICRPAARRRLLFEDEEEEERREEEEEEDENVRILQLQAQLMSQSPPRDVMMESPPDLSPDVEWLGDLVYEPPVFNLYTDEDVPEYNIRPAFEGQPDVDLMDTSPMETIERIPMHLRDFRWMDSPDCGSRCPGAKR